jgi:hypothetical protein
VIGVAEDDVARQGVRDDVLQVVQLHVAPYADELLRRCQRDDLAVIGVGEGGHRLVGGGWL